MQEVILNLGAAWTDEEIKALISIWGDSKVQQELDGAVKNKSIFVKVQNELEKQGYKHSWQQCRSKIKTRLQAFVAAVPIKNQKYENSIPKSERSQWGDGERKDNMQILQGAGPDPWPQTSIHSRHSCTHQHCLSWQFIRVPAE